MNREDGRNPIGRVISATLKTARVEFTEIAEIGLIVQMRKNGERILARIEKLETNKYSGLTGYIYFLDPIDQPPETMQEVYSADDEVEGGILMIGKDYHDLDVKINLNPLFNHVLVTGMTRQGKTHFMIVLLEELIPLGVPSLVLDPHGQFVNLVKTFPGKVVIVREVRMPDLKSYLQQKTTVIYNLLGLPKVSKANRIAELLEQLMVEKEKDYAQADNDPMLLEMPPVLVFLDEAEIFAPDKTSRGSSVRSDALDATITIAKEGGKFGLGLIAAPQRATKLDVDVRGQCNSAAIFKLVDFGSIRAVSLLDYITKTDMKKVNAFDQGQCLLVGDMVKRPRIIRVRDIVTEKVKKMDFEEMLGIEKEPKALLPMKEPRIKVLNSGDVIDVDTGEVVETAESRLILEDRKAFQKADGDGIIRRGPLTSEDEETLKRIRRT